MKEFKDIDYGFHPESYREVTDPLGALLLNAKGTNRRQMIRDYWEAGRIEELADSHLLDSLSDEQLERLGKIHPTFMGDEYLPGYRSGEVEIWPPAEDFSPVEILSAPLPSGR